MRRASCITRKYVVHVQVPLLAWRRVDVQRRRFRCALVVTRPRCETREREKVQFQTVQRTKCGCATAKDVVVIDPAVRRSFPPSREGCGGQAGWCGGAVLWREAGIRAQKVCRHARQRLNSVSNLYHNAATAHRVSRASPRKNG